MASVAGSSFINHSSVNVLRWGALAFGVYWGYSKKSSLTYFVKAREHEAEKKHYGDLVEEGKVAFEAAYNREQAAKAEKAGVAAIDSDSFRFIPERWINWAIADMEKDEKAKKK
ncbi:hypothetical protein HDU97_009064 [Phlyctochytrium planicorne]|nr:hypothetical protein HDU97_009064 [Phlyctochytrium planicorne]